MAGLTTNDVGECCCSGGVICQPCICNMCLGALKITWSGGIEPAGSSTLAYDSINNWWTGTIGSGTYAATVQLECDGYMAISYLGGTCVGNTLTFGLSLVDYVCDPMSIHYQAHVADVACTPPDSDRYKDIYITGCVGGICAVCTSSVIVTGCNGLVLAGASVVVKDAGGSTLGSGATDGSGIFSFNNAMAGGSITASKLPRLGSFTNSPAETSCSGFKTTTTGAIAAGYACMYGCADPPATVLFATFSIAGVVTLTYSPGAWSGTVAVAGHDYVITLTNFDDGAGDLTVVATITKDGVDCGDITYTQVSCPPSFSATLDLPFGACATDLGAAASISE